MKIFLRVDSSISIGSGHVMRCLTLANALREKGSNIFFICRELPGNLCDFIEYKGYMVHRLPYTEKHSYAIQQSPPHMQWLGIDTETDIEETKYILVNVEDIDWLIVDHYALDIKWETQMRPYVRKIMVIDDLADRHHDCDLLLDQNLYKHMGSRYDGLLPDYSFKLLGPQFALLRPEFEDARKSIRDRDGTVKRILLFFGSSDLTNETSKALEAICLLDNPTIAVDIVIGTNNPYRHDIENIAAKIPQTTCYYNTSSMAKLMLAADICIGAAGITTWERCCLGLPSLVVTVAQNQIGATMYLAEKKIIYFIGENSKITAYDIKAALNIFFENPMLLKQYSQASRELVDGGGVQRCTDIMVSYFKGNR